MNPRRAEREALGLSLVEAAKSAGVGIATWRRWEEDPESVKASTRGACEQALLTYRRAVDLGLEVRKPSESEPLRLLTIDQVAERLASSRSHVYTLISEGSLRASDIASASSGQRSIRVFAPDVDAFILARAIAPETIASDPDPS